MNALNTFSGVNNHIIRILCNIVKPEYINNLLVKQILQISVANQKVPGEYIHIIPRHISYRKLNFQHIQNIHLELLNNNLKSIQLQGGETLVTLHFRPRASK